MNNAICSNMMQLETINPSEVSQKKRDRHHMIAIIHILQNLKYDTNEPIYKTESQTQRTAYGCQGGVAWGKDGVGGWTQQA